MFSHTRVWGSSLERSVNKTTWGITREDPEASTTDHQRLKLYELRRNLQVCQLKTLRQRREDLCRNFIEKTLKKTDQFKDFFVPPSSKEMNLRHSRKVSELRCKTNRLRNSAIPYLTRLINNTWVYTNLYLRLFRVFFLLIYIYLKLL